MLEILNLNVNSRETTRRLPPAFLIGWRFASV